MSDRLVEHVRNVLGWLEVVHEAVAIRLDFTAHRLLLVELAVQLEKVLADCLWQLRHQALVDGLVPNEHLAAMLSPRQLACPTVVFLDKDECPSLLALARLRRRHLYDAFKRLGPIGAQLLSPPSLEQSH